MSRLVEMQDEGPLVIDPDDQDDVVAVCRCGLSGDWPYCDGTHADTRDEDDQVLYVYDRGGGDVEREPVEVLDPSDADPRA